MYVFEFELFLSIIWQPFELCFRVLVDTGRSSDWVFSSQWHKSRKCSEGQPSAMYYV